MRFARVALLWIVAAAGCNKPETDDCRKAIENMQHIIGTENLSGNGDNEGEVRRCRGGSSKEAVQCAIKAQTKDDLAKCDFMKVPHKAGDGAASGSSDKK